MKTTQSTTITAGINFSSPAITQADRFVCATATMPEVFIANNATKP